ncbi:hypothetical protein E4Q23_20860 [Candidatus Accumulibacter phosphatis]|uniref:Thioredoxin-like fold domain-containing protein n=1 Tax=Candidatus Accumulibacter phosphatis TaxID=327160 RepID=A0ABX1U335_9PROT|nr:thioredoxin domain-containing protein [Candidatus Accumulibacter phosphatis]NMQ29991.1 hypothetical protein [Candidatus Accumulibacter phosphatis]
MSRKWMVLATVAVVVLAFAAGVVVFTGRTNQEVTAAAQTHSDALVRPHSPIYGNPAAKVTIVEFFDPSCEACRAFYPIVKRIVNPKFRDRVCGGPATADQRLRRRPNERAGRREATANALGCRQTGWRDPSGIISAARDERDRPCLTAGVSLPPWKKRGTTGWDSQ